MRKYRNLIRKYRSVVLHASPGHHVLQSCHMRTGMASPFCTLQRSRKPSPEKQHHSKYFQASVQTQSQGHDQVNHLVLRTCDWTQRLKPLPTMPTRVALHMSRWITSDFATVTQRIFPSHYGEPRKKIVAQLTYAVQVNHLRLRSCDWTKRLKPEHTMPTARELQKRLPWVCPGEAHGTLPL